MKEYTRPYIPRDKSQTTKYQAERKRVKSDIPLQLRRDTKMQAAKYEACHQDCRPRWDFLS
jgi:hypothetical protein